VRELRQRVVAGAHDDDAVAGPGELHQPIARRGTLGDMLRLPPARGDARDNVFAAHVRSTVPP
jgi:hypothetical protein